MIQTQIMTASAGTKALSSPHEPATVSSTIAEALAAHVSCLTQLEMCLVFAATCLGVS